MEGGTDECPMRCHPAEDPGGVRTPILVPRTHLGTLPPGTSVALTPGCVGKWLPWSRCRGDPPDHP